MGKVNVTITGATAKHLPGGISIARALHNNMFRLVTTLQAAKCERPNHNLYSRTCKVAFFKTVSPYHSRCC